MTDPVKAVAAAASIPADRQGPGGADPQPAPASKPAAPAKSQDALRLVIEPTSGGQSYTYKLFDRVTGALLIELPREEATKMSESPGYSAGKVYDAKA